MRLPTLVFSCVAAAVGCGGDGAPQLPPDGSGYRLGPAGDAQLVLHPGDVGDRFALSQSDLVRTKVDGVPTQLVHANVE